MKVLNSFTYLIVFVHFFLISINTYANSELSNLFCNKPYDSICNDSSYNRQDAQRLSIAKQKAIEQLVYKKELPRSKREEALTDIGTLDDMQRLQYINYLLQGLDNTPDVRLFYASVKEHLLLGCRKYLFLLRE